MDRAQLKGILEALIFAAEEPIGEQSFANLLQPEGVEKGEIRSALAELVSSWNDNPHCGMKLEEIAGGFQFRTRETTAEWVRRLFASKPSRLSQAAMETLAIVAYRQPVIRSEIEDVRGVDCGAVIKKLLERGLIRIVGKREEPGQPLIYGTTKEFLELFGLPSLKDLPPLKDLRELAQRRAEELARKNVDDGENKIGMPDAAAADPGSAEGRESDDEMMTELENRDVHQETNDDIMARLGKDEAEDEDALTNLESNIKNLRRLERAIYPGIFPREATGAGGEENAQTNETFGEGATSCAAGEECHPPEGAVQEGAPEQVDRADE